VQSGWRYGEGVGDRAAGVLSWYDCVANSSKRKQRMVQVLAATFKDGVFKPDQRPALSDSARVRLVVETIDGDESARRDQAWTTLQQLWDTSRFNSGGDRLTRDQLHKHHR
jgi:hypothetical protein